MQRSSRCVTRLSRVYKACVVVGVGLALLGMFLHMHTSAQPSHSVTIGSKKPPATACTAHTEAHSIIVSITARHLWACAGHQQQYDSAVVTGDMNQAANLTPVGTYHIFAKQTDLYLDGADNKGSWHDHVKYWMPWLSNQYGVYGFHDATWRKPTDFGHIDPYSSSASHGCVELSLATAAWLYKWADVGTTVVIER